MLNSDESIIEFDTSFIVSKTAFNFFNVLFLSNNIVLDFFKLSLFSSSSSFIIRSCFKILIWLKSYVFVFFKAYLYTFVVVLIVLSIFVLDLFLFFNSFLSFTFFWELSIWKVEGTVTSDTLFVPALI